MNALLHGLARALGRHAERVLAVVHPEQGRAIVAEIAHVASPWDALRFAAGGVLAAWRGRFSLPALGVVGARLAIAMAAGAVGWIHLQIAGRNLAHKIAMMAGESVGMTPYVAGVIDQHGLAYWAWRFGVLGGMGALHVAAALAMALGATRAVGRIAMAVAILAVAMPMLKNASGLTFPIIYLAQIGLMVLAAGGLARLWRWDARRLAGRRL